MYIRTKLDLAKELSEIKEQGLYKDERIILSDQKASISVRFPDNAKEREVLNFCANNYLGLANHPALIKAAHETLDTYGFGLASVRFICGTQDIHKQLEKQIAKFYHTEDTILYSSC
ncbi:MAG: aminotransferase class I/II-fold pyridoxal phosphate-dependent enzyme, partial [Ignavibacteria bacterium]